MRKIGHFTSTLGAIAGAVVLAVALSGCATFALFAYQKDPRSGVGDQTTRLFLLGKVENVPGARGVTFEPDEGNPAEPLPLPTEAITENLQASISQCVPEDRKERLFPGMAVPLIGFALQTGIDAVVDFLAAKAKSIQDASLHSYSARLITTASDFKERGQCLLIVRRGPGMDEAGNEAEDMVNLVGLFKIQRRFEPSNAAQDDAFSLELIYFRLNNSVAWTASGKSLKIGFGFAGRDARTKADKVNEVRLFADPSTELGGVKYKEEVINAASTGLFPLPADDSTLVEINVAITEVGAGAPNAERVRAEAEAVAKAIGPSITTQVEGFFQPKP